MEGKTVTNLRLPLILAVILCVGGSSAVTVHFTSPGGGFQSYVAGLYRLTIDVDSFLEDSSAFANDSRRQPDFICATVGNTGHTGLSIASSSYDPTTERVTLLQYQSPRTFFSGEICKPQESCRDRQKLTSFAPKVKTTDGGDISSAASWDGIHYFIYTPDTSHAVYFGYKPYLQLRQIKTDFKFSRANYPDAIDVDSFSLLLANLTTDDPSRRLLQAGSSLAVFPAESQGLIFVTVVREALYPNPPYVTDLLEFGFALAVGKIGTTEEDEMKILHVTDDTWKGWYSHSIGHEGSVSYKDGVLCWTAVDTILCGTWSPEQPLTPPTDLLTVLSPGQAASVCGENWSTKFYTNVTTGVTILQTPEQDGRLSLLFGCFSSVTNAGGMGLLVRQPDDGSTEIVSVSDQYGKVLAGSLFTTPDTLCPAPTSDNSGSNTVPATVAATVSGASRRVTGECVMSLLLVVLCFCWFSS